MRLAWILVAAAALSGCVSVQHIPMDAGNADALKGREVTLAKWEQPDFVAMTAGRAAVGGLIGALMMQQGGQNVVNNFNLRDPAGPILESMVQELKAAHGWRFPGRELLVDTDDAAALGKQYPDTDVVLEMRTINWGYSYFPTAWNRYRVFYSGRLRVIDAKKGRVLAEGLCSRAPENSDDAPSGDELLAGGGQRLKEELNAAVRDCVQHFRSQTFALAGPAVSVAAAAPEPTPASRIIPTEKGAEIIFWQSIKDSQDPADFRAYLEQYPNGDFAALARNRLKALGQPVPVAAAAPAPAPAREPKSTHPWPSAGDTWTYRLVEPKRLDGPRTRNYTVKVSAASAASVVEQYEVEGGARGQWEHKGERQVVSLGVPVLSPYLLAFGRAPSGSLGTLKVAHPSCGTVYICEASARVVGSDRVRVPAGQFDAVKIEVRQNWRPMAISGQQSTTGGSTLTVWYSHAAKRAVKVTSRAAFGYPGPLDTDFDLELASYTLQ